MHMELITLCSLKYIQLMSESFLIQIYQYVLIRILPFAKCFGSIVPLSDIDYTNDELRCIRVNHA
jgi:hypothetical protein